MNTRGKPLVVKPQLRLQMARVDGVQQQGNHVDRANNDKVAEMNAAWGNSDTDTVEITLSISVHNRSMLWDAAVMKALSASSLRIGDLIDVIGPREDPCVAECIAILTQPAEIPGCALEDFDVEPFMGAQVLAHPQGLIAA